MLNPPCTCVELLTLPAVAKFMVLLGDATPVEGAAVDGIWLSVSGIVTTSMHVPAESGSGSLIQSTVGRSRRRTTCPLPLLLPSLCLAFWGGDVVLSELEVLSWVCPEDDVLVCVVLVLPE